MVWIMNLSMGFGEFFPDGNWEEGDNPKAIGWSGRLKAQIKELPNEQRHELLASGDWFDYPYYVAKKFIHEVGSKPDVDLPPITPVLPHEAPTTFNTAKGYKSLGDFIMLNDRILAVSEDLKAILQDLDEGSKPHQFFPIEVVQPRSVYPNAFYTLVIADYRDAFRDGGGSMPPLNSGERYTFSQITQKDAAHFTFRRGALEGAHLWRERVFNEFFVMFSDELKARAEAAGLNMPRMYRAKEVD